MPVEELKKKKHTHSGFIVFRVSLSVELCLVVIGCVCLSIKRTTNEKPPRAGQKATEVCCSIKKNLIQFFKIVFK